MWNDDNWRIQNQKTEEWQCSLLHLLSLHKEKQVSEMFSTLYQTGRIGSPVIILNTKSFFATRLGGGVRENGKSQFQKLRPIRGCLCERERNKNFCHFTKVGATSQYLPRPRYRKGNLSC